MALKTVLDDLGLTQTELRRTARMSRSATSRLATLGQWPARATVRMRRAVADSLRGAGATRAHFERLCAAGVFAAFELLPAPAQEKAPTSYELDGAGTTTLTTPAVTPHASAIQPQEDAMLLENVALTPEAKKAFGLPRSPFIDDVVVRDDVFASPGTRYVRSALMDCALNHGFIAIIGESGSGKTTLREELEERIRDEDRPVLVIKPYTLAMEPNDQQGKMMKSGQIAEAIARTLAPSLQLKSSPEARYRQVHELLQASCRAGSRHLLVIEEAHRMPLATLKHLKGWMELKDGLRRLLGVCLIGQPELGTLLGEHRPEIREIVQRCEKVTMEPLDQHLEAYLAHKLARVGAKAADVFAEDAYDALRARLTYVPRNGRAGDAVSTCYPLAVANRVCRAMNAAALNGWPKVDAAVVAGS